MKSLFLSWLPRTSFVSMLLLFTASFRPAPAGGEGFEISLNGQILARRFGTEMHQPPQLRLTASALSGNLSVTYYHCGKIASRRELTLQNTSGQNLQVWRFNESGTNSLNSTKPSMEFPGRELLSALRKAGVPLRLMYTSSENKDAKWLATLELTAQ